MDYIERTVGDVDNQLRSQPEHFVSEEGQLFVAGHGAIRAPARRGRWEPALFATGVALFASFLIAHNVGVELSAAVFMVTAIGGLALTLIGGIAFAAWITTKPVLL